MFRSNRMYRYITAGLLSLLFEITLLLVLSKIIGLKPILAVSISFWLTLLVSFGLQKLFAFQDYQKTIKSLSKQLGGFSALVGFNYFFTLAVVAMFPDSWLIFSRLLSLSFITIWNYFIYKYLFK